MARCFRVLGNTQPGIGDSGAQQRQCEYDSGQLPDRCHRCYHPIERRIVLVTKANARSRRKKVYCLLYPWEFFCSIGAACELLG